MVHLKTHMQFVDLALGKSEEADVGVPQSLVDRGDILEGVSRP